MNVSLLVLGCKISQYDAAQLEEALRQAGACVVDPSVASHAFLLCGCAVTEKAAREADQLARRLKKLNPQAALLYCGCLGSFRSQVPGQMTDQCFRPGDTAGVLRALGLEVSAAVPPTRQSWRRTRGLVKVQDGCDHFCSYCIVPYLRGRSRSRPLDVVVEEVGALAQAGFREVVLSGVHLSTYGRDLPPGEASLFQLLEALEETPGLERVRLSSLEPMDLDPESIRRLARFTRLCPHLHLPLQSGSDPILQAMHRGYDRAHYLGLVEAAKASWDAAAITTDVMVGFPGETEADFEGTVSLLREAGFARLHIFRFSPRPGTEAATLPNPVEEKTKRARLETLQGLAQDLESAYAERFLGQVLPVLVERVRGEEAEGLTPNYLRVRFFSDSPITCGGSLPVRLLSREKKWCMGRAE